MITRREVRDQFRDWRIIFPNSWVDSIFPLLDEFYCQRPHWILFPIMAHRSLLIGWCHFYSWWLDFFPISVSLVIALESFVGEKERGSIEPLLNTPLKDWQIYLGKLLSSTVPPLMSSYIGMAVYLVGLSISKVTLPDISIILQLVALTTVQAVVMVAGAVIVSTQTTSVRAANLLASFIVIPSALLIQGESVVIFWGDYTTLWWAVLGMTLFGILLVRVGLAHFRREELLGREIDVLNIKWGWKVFYSRFQANSINLREWYLFVFKSIVEHRIPILIVTILFLSGLVIGYQQSFKFIIPLDQAGVQILKIRS